MGYAWLRSLAGLFKPPTGHAALQRPDPVVRVDRDAAFEHCHVNGRVNRGANARGRHAWLRFELL